MTVRLATEDDLFDVMVLAKEFCKEAPDYFTWDKEKVQQLLIQAINEPSFVLFVSTTSDGEITGGILGACTEMFMSRVKIAAELSWFMSKDHRGNRHAIELVKAFESWAEASEAKYVIMADIRGIADLSKLYEKMDYSMSEVSYIKEMK